jgi:hypothetical protein
MKRREFITLLGGSALESLEPTNPSSLLAQSPLVCHGYRSAALTIRPGSPTV